MLIRYGLQMETPNCQNMLLQLDRNLRPTGKLVFRDISDSDFVTPVARGIGAEDLLETDHLLGFRPKDSLNLQTMNSLWRLDEAGELSVPTEVLGAWAIQHDIAYVNEAKRLLNEYASGVMWVSTVQELDYFLKAEAGQRALQSFHRR